MSRKSHNMYMLFRLMSLRSVNLSDVSQAIRKGSQIAPYHSSKSLSWPSDSGQKPVVKLRRSAFGSANLRRKAKVSSEWEDGPQHYMDSSQTLVGRNHHSEMTPATLKRRTGAKHKIPSELRILSLEDLPAGNQKALGASKADKPLVTDKRDDVVFGLYPCLLALTQGRRKVTRVFVKASEGQQKDALQEVCEEAVKRDVQIKWVSKRDLDKLTHGRVHQGVCLQASPLQYLREWSVAPQKPEPRNKTPLWLVLDGIQDPMNLGAILRSAYFLGVDRIASSIQNSCSLTPVVSKASSGVMEIVELYGYDNLEDMIQTKKEQGWQIVGTVGVEEESPEAPPVKCSDFQMLKPTLLLIGGEGSGLSTDLRSRCDALLTIPPRRELHPGVESLNVSVATGILLHSLLTSRPRGRR
ncbi:hypothetical protein ACEWY4_008997 [Coilia grayii]|uniref:rRNA methyltransferase 1, mitochondrial n=1 Tax=Coilia grayii TaxID=363190 RepID=A0ABD1K5U8_9TELE